jgi:general secretion pathway protein E
LPGESIREPVGCPSCRGEGYRGRTALYEIIEVDRELERMIHDGASEADLERAARLRGPSLLADGAARIRAGDTSISEVARVAVDV